MNPTARSDHVPFRVVAPPKPGLSAAREMGLHVSAHDVVIFCDDDTWLAADGLQFMHEIPERRLAWSYFLTMVEMALRTKSVMEAYALALSGETVAEDDARRMWWTRCVGLMSSVVREPVVLVGVVRPRERSSAAVQWRRLAGTWRGWTAIGRRYAEVVAAATALRADRPRT